MSFLTAKKSLAAYKGHLNVAVKSFTTLLKIKPNPTPESVVKLYSRLQSRMDVAFNSLDNLNSFFEDAEVMKDEKVDVESEKKQASSYYEELRNFQLEKGCMPHFNRHKRQIRQFNP